MFCSLLEPEGGARKLPHQARRSVADRCELAYERNTAVLVSIARDARGNAIKITTWCPRYYRRGRLYRPPMLMRRVEPLAGRPAVHIDLRAGRRLWRPGRSTGSSAAITCASLTPHQSLRVTTDAPFPI